jgi:hypothetical protein
VVSNGSASPFNPPGPLDLADVQNQETAKRALEIAAAGGHPILVTGPSGSGKTLLCRCLLPKPYAGDALLAAIPNACGLAGPAAQTTEEGDGKADGIVGIEDGQTEVDLPR